MVPGTRGQAPRLDKSLVLSSEQSLRASSGIREMALATINLQVENKDGAGPHAPTQSGQAVTAPQPPALMLVRWEGAAQTGERGLSALEVQKGYDPALGDLKGDTAFLW